MKRPRECTDSCFSSQVYVIILSFSSPHGDSHRFEFLLLPELNPKPRVFVSVIALASALFARLRP